LERDSCEERLKVEPDLRGVPPERREQLYAERIENWRTIDQKLRHDAIAVLTEEQRKNFRLLRGKKIDLDLQAELLKRPPTAPDIH
jgi:hypothetical protein